MHPMMLMIVSFCVALVALVSAAETVRVEPDRSLLWFGLAVLSWGVGMSLLCRWAWRKREQV
jgi:hypothetical protein